MTLSFEDTGIVLLNGGGDETSQSRDPHVAANAIEQRESLDAIQEIMTYMEQHRHTDPYFRDKYSAKMRLFWYHITRLVCCDELADILRRKYDQYCLY
jgi:hypothetical protein